MPLSFGRKHRRFSDDEIISSLRDSAAGFRAPRRVVATVYMGRSCMRGILTKGRDGNNRSRILGSSRT